MQAWHPDGGAWSLNRGVITFRPHPHREQVRSQ